MWPWVERAPAAPMAQEESHQPLSFHTLICHWLLPLAEPNWNPEARKLDLGSQQRIASAALGRPRGPPVPGAVPLAHPRFCSQGGLWVWAWGGRSLVGKQILGLALSSLRQGKLPAQGMC